MRNYMNSGILSTLILHSTQLVFLEVALLCICFFADSSCVAGQGNIRLQGNTQLTGFKWNGEPFVNVYDNFTLDLDQSGKWLMTSYSTMDTNGCIVSGYDGINMFVVLYTSRILKAKDSTELTEEVPYEQARHSAVISTGEYPFDLYPIMKFSWFALISGQSLSHARSDRMPAPWLEARTDLLAYSFSNRFKQNASWPMCLMDAEFITIAQSIGNVKTNLLIPNDKASLMYRREQEEKVKGLQSDVLAARYSVQHYSNFSGMIIPTTYTLDVFWPGVGVNSEKTNVAQRFTGTITNIEYLEEAITGRPDPIGSITVRDYRFKYSDAMNAVQELRYKITDRRWKEIGDPTLQRGFEIMKRNSPRFNNLLNRTTKWIVLSVLLIVSFIPVFWLFMKKKKR
jgi:hypothetical protein